MADPVLHLIAGPNGAGKSTLYERVLEPVVHLEFVNADIIAAELWPDDPKTHAYEAATMAAQRRDEPIAARASFITETVFSHESKIHLVRDAVEARYLVTLHVVMVPVELAVARVASRVDIGGHDVPESKIRERCTRLWPLVADVIPEVDTVTVYDNSSAATPMRVVASYQNGSLVGEADWPRWTPEPLRTRGAERDANDPPPADC